MSGRVTLRLRRGKAVHVVEVHESEGLPSIRIDGRPFEADIVRLADGTYSVLGGSRSLEVTLVETAGGWTAHSGPRRYRLRSEEAAATSDSAGSGPGSLQEVRASLPGKILQVQVEPGARVREGDGLVVIEAMKMENELRAPCEARVASVAVGPGETVESGALLLVLEALSAAPEEPEE